MRRVALIYNPASGQYSARRAAVVRDALAVLHKAGIEAEALETNAPGSAGALAKAAMRSRYDTILACGGDGTVHEVLQCLVGTDVALGVVPLGTANALAQNLGLGKSPVKAMRLLLAATPTQVPVGRIFYRDSAGAERSRYFTVAAGIGADALLMSRLDAELKRRLGYALYVVEAFNVWVTNPFPLFSAEFTVTESADKRVELVSQLLAVRVRSFGGVLGKLAPGATLRNRTLSLMAFKTRSRLRYLTFLLAVIAGRHTFSKEVELLEAVSVECRTRNGSQANVFVEADGEVLGTLPAAIEVASQTLTLLIPPNAQP
ncbi:MAG: YegS/Rv2252/BmrU family lipid kinase [Terracidiphilus sp.]